jgi:hypothetical protein
MAEIPIPSAKNTDSPAFREIPSTTPALSDVQGGLYWLGALVGGTIAFFGKGSQVWLWVLPLSMLALPGALRQSIRGEDRSAPQAKATFNRPRMWILGLLGALLTGNGLATHYWPTLVFGIAYIGLALVSSSIGTFGRARAESNIMSSK